MPPQESVALLFSGGIDSSVLLAELAKEYREVYPLYVQNGLAWEKTERTCIDRFLKAFHSPHVKPLTLLDLPIQDLQRAHWSVTGKGVPDEASDDTAVYIPGRNIFLLAKAGVWCNLKDIRRIAIGILKGNPFPDTTPSFFEAVEESFSRGLRFDISILTPFSHLSKKEVIQRGEELPLELTFSCFDPHGESHCGRCNKCGERRRAFRNAAIPDKTRYAG